MENINGSEKVNSPSAHPFSLSRSFVCPEVRKHTVVLNYQAQSAAGIFAGGSRFSTTKAARSQRRVSTNSY